MAKVGLARMDPEHALENDIEPLAELVDEALQGLEHASEACRSRYGSPSMMTYSELLERLEHGENSGVAFKRDAVQDHELARDLVAFLNLEGGILVLGAHGNGTIAGLARDRLKERVFALCRDKIRPAITPFFEIFVNVQSGLDLAVVKVPRGIYVHSLWHDHRHAYCIRVGSKSLELTPEELKGLFVERGMSRTELSPVSGARISDLDLRRLRFYFQQVRQQDTPADDDMIGWQRLLVNTMIMTEDGITLAALLLFGSVPNRFLPQAGVSAAAFSGPNKEDAAKERAGLRGAMTPLMDQQGALFDTGPWSNRHWNLSGATHQ